MITKGTTVKPKTSAPWNIGYILKLNTDEDRALVSADVDGRERHIWVDVDQLIEL